MDKISQMLKQNKPDITDSSIRAYTANLSKLHSRLHTRNHSPEHGILSNPNM